MATDRTGKTTTGHILVKSDKNVVEEWKTLRRNEPIPPNAVEVGRDHCNDRTWVGRYCKDGEAGKINCLDNDSENPTMCKFYSHSASSAFIGSKGYREAEILILRWDN